MVSVCIVNLAALDPESNGGLSRVARELSRLFCDLSQEQPTFYPIFAVGERFSSRFSQWIDRKPVIIPVNPQHPGRAILRGLNPDLIVSPLFGVEPFDQIEEFAGVRHIAVMPDALAFDLPQTLPAHIRAQRYHSYQKLKSAYRVITLTEYARNQLIHHLQLTPESIAAIHLGADPIDSNAAAKTALKLPQPYLFYPANTWLHKRHKLAIEIFRLILQQRPDMHLVLTGGRVAEFDVSLPDLIASNHIPADRVHDLGYLSDDQIPSLYRNAEALLFTSSFEGFGMPVLEAMQLGCPVVCAPLTALPEVAGDAALYVNSEDPQEWANTILNELPVQRMSLIQRGYQRAAQFTWKKTNEQYRNFFLETVPDVFGVNAKLTSPLVKLPLVFQEIEAGVVSMPQFEADESHANSLTASSQIDLNVHLQYMQSLLQEESRSAVGKIPFVGLFARALIRLRNIGRFWRSSSMVIAEIARRQSILAAEINANPRN